MVSGIARRQLKFKFHGKILDHFGIQSYQSPVAAIAELVSNSWDADAENVWIELPKSIVQDSVIEIRDDGSGMTFDECQDKYLKIGFNRRGSDPVSRSPMKNRVVLGRKGIGKFSGFGIAKEIEVETISGKNGQRTKFVMNLDELRGDEFILNEKQLDAQVEELGEGGKNKKGTTVTLRRLILARNISKTQFPLSLSRRFLLHEMGSDFKISVDDKFIPDSADLSQIEFAFPRDYEKEELYDGLKLDGEWGEENIGDYLIRWKFVFYKDTIGDDELQGVSIFSHGKMAQKPFLFNSTGGIYGQGGAQYLSGVVMADYIDEFDKDIISTERQRINFELPETQSLLTWGNKKLRELLPMWAERRGRDRELLISQKVSVIGDKIQKFQPTEKKTIEKVIRKIASIPTIKEQQFVDLSIAIVSAWESGRLKELITKISEVPELTEKDLLDTLIEADALTALEISEVAKTRRDTITGLKERVRNQELENAVRDYISKNPWLIAPQWETFRIEKGVKSIIEAAAHTAELDKTEYAGRVDLALSSGQELLIMEFVRPSKNVDWDHINRFERYVLEIRTRVTANSKTAFKLVKGYMVSDGIEKSAAMIEKIKNLESNAMWCSDWDEVIDASTQKWSEFLEILSERGSKSERIRDIMSP